MSLHTTPESASSSGLSVAPREALHKNLKPASEAPATLNGSPENEPEEIDGRPAANSFAAWALGINWPIAIWIGIVHLLALAAPFYVTWQAVVTCFALVYVTGSLGVCMGYHRLLTHGSFKTYRPVRWLLAFIGGLSGEGSAVTWVADHRRHHKYSDQHGDPHSPNDGAWWSHMNWLFPNWSHKSKETVLKKYAGDIMKDRVMMLIHHMFLPTHILSGIALFAIGYYGQWMGLAGGFDSGMSMMLWGLAVRMVWVMHVTWFVNSASHMWGYRNYETTDTSRNNWWVAILAFGEGWHNNHHAYQRVASQGHKWWEFDTTYWMILAMEKLGLAWDVIRLSDVRRKSAVG